MEYYEFVWKLGICKDGYDFVWRCMDKYGLLWICMDISLFYF